MPEADPSEADPLIECVRLARVAQRLRSNADRTRPLAEASAAALLRALEDRSDG